MPVLEGLLGLGVEGVVELGRDLAEVGQGGLEVGLVGLDEAA